jgi:hypothetical protein
MSGNDYTTKLVASFLGIRCVFKIWLTLIKITSIVGRHLACPKRTCASFPSRTDDSPRQFLDPKMPISDRNRATCSECSSARGDDEAMEVTEVDQLRCRGCRDRCAVRRERRIRAQSRVSLPDNGRPFRTDFCRSRPPTSLTM